MTTSECPDLRQPATRRHFADFASWLKHAFALSRQRQQLAKLDAAALKDLGLTREQVRRETAQPFWMQPDFGRVSSPRQADAARMGQYRRQ